MLEVGHRKTEAKLFFQSGQEVKERDRIRSPGNRHENTVAGRKHSVFLDGLSDLCFKSVHNGKILRAFRGQIKEGKGLLLERRPA